MREHEIRSNWRTDRETIGYGYYTTLLALLSDEGAWFRLDRSYNLEVCFLSARGSAICDSLTKKFTFLFVCGDDGAMHCGLIGPSFSENRTSLDPPCHSFSYWARAPLARAFS